MPRDSLGETKLHHRVFEHEDNSTAVGVTAVVTPAMGVQALPPKEANLFKLIVKAYETKQYKKGLKAADQILKRLPDHGETLSMKGLILNCVERKQEAYDLVRKGLKFDLKSHVSWHVYGLLYRSDREYREAIKCYRNALRIDPENIQILRDLSLLQAQMRDRPGFVETRRQLLTLKPSHRNNWIAFALAQHCNGNASMAVQILQAYEGTLEDDYPPDSERYEHSEMLLYKAMVLEESGNLQDALVELDKHEINIIDKLSLKEQRAALLLQLQRPAEAEKLYRLLLEINPDNYNYYKGLQACLGLQSGAGGNYSSTKVDMLVPLYKELQRLYSKSSAAKRIPLDFLENAAFEEAVETYIRPLLRKGVPSVFSDLRPLYNRPGKADLLDAVFVRLEVALRSTGKFPPSREEADPPLEGPSTLLWLLFLLAQHYDRRRLTGRALEKIDEAIRHTPTVTDLYLVKGRILKHAGDPAAAAALADEARTMDLADRFLNSEAVKRMLQADQVDCAEKTAALFTKDGEQHDNLFDMQCMWYELASGDSHLRQNAYGRALKKYLAVHKHYNDMVEDQFDFHTYCLRKMTLRAYVKMLRFEDNLHSHRCFCRGAHGAIRCYLTLYETPQKAAAEEEEAALAAMSPADRKKLRQKQRKAEARAKKEAEEKQKVEEEKAPVPPTKGANKKNVATVRPVDTDPDGAKLAQVEDPLGEAGKFIRLLQEHAGGDIETHLLAFQVFMHRQKLLLALQALKKQRSIHPDSPAGHCCLMRFFHAVAASPEPSSEAERLVHSVIDAEREEMGVLSGPNRQLNLLELNEAFLQKHSDSLLPRAAAAEMLVLLNPNERERAVEIVESSQNVPVTGNSMAAEGIGAWELKDCVHVHRLLQGPLHDSAAAERWRQRCAALFPYSVHFRGELSSEVKGIPSTTDDSEPETVDVDLERPQCQAATTNGVGNAPHH